MMVKVKKTLMTNGVTSMITVVRMLRTPKTNLKMTHRTRVGTQTQNQTQTQLTGQIGASLMKRRRRK